MQFVIISGLSGAGKSKAASIMEDMGFYIVDNMPAILIPKFAELCMSGRYDRVALVTDVRGGRTFDELFSALAELREMKCSYKVLYLEASVETVIKRYKESRRSHPLMTGNPSLSMREAAEKERELLAPVRRLADYILDTSALPVSKLRGELLSLFDADRTMGGMSVSVISFGYKYGLPMEADLVMDVRFLPNPFYVPELRPLTGLDAQVRDYIMKYDVAREFLRRMEDMLAFLLPLYAEEGKSALVIAIGCTGGQHRSVALTHEIAELVRRLGYQAGEAHRDMTRA